MLDCAKMLPVAVALEAELTVYDAPCTRMRIGPKLNINVQAAAALLMRS